MISPTAFLATKYEAFLDPKRGAGDFAASKDIEDIIALVDGRPELDKEISAELAKVKDRLLELQSAKKAVKQIYDGACSRMGVKSQMEVTDLNLTDLVKSN